MLNLLGALLFAAILACLSIENWRANNSIIISLFGLFSSIYAVGAYKFYNRSGGKLARQIILWAIVLRVVASLGSYQMSHPLSNDTFRYLWEGRVVAAGYNPYLLSPNSNQLSKLRAENEELWRNVDHRELPALYPALTQLFFALISGSEIWFRCVLFVSELLVLGLLLYWLRLEKLAEGRLLLYAFCPIPIFEISVNTHLDGLMILPMLFGALLAYKAELATRISLAKAKTYWISAIVFLCIASLVKQTAVIMLGVVLLRTLSKRLASKTQWLIAMFFACAITLACYWPFVQSGEFFGSLKAFSRDWRFNAHLFYALVYSLEWILGWIPLEKTTLAKLLIAIVLTVLAIRRREKSIISQSALLFF